MHPSRWFFRPLIRNIAILIGHVRYFIYNIMQQNAAILKFF